MKSRCQTCGDWSECRRIGKEDICHTCLNKYSYIRTLVIEATPLDQLPTGALPRE